MEPEDTLKEVRDDELVGAYITLRDKRKDRKVQWETIDNQYAAQLDKIQGELLRRQDERGITQIKVAGVGTAYKSTSVVASCADWDVFNQWLVAQIQGHLENGTDPTQVFAFFQKRLTIDTVKQFMENNEGGVPPAVNVVNSYTVGIRRSSN